MKLEIELDRYEIILIATRIAKENLLNPALVLAIIEQESNFTPTAMRFEPQFKYILNPDIFSRKNRISLATEINLQQISWGLMQIMGAVTRELGFDKEMPLMLVPETNIHFGCLKLSQLLSKYATLENAVSSYNQGSPMKLFNGTYRNQEYVTSVLSKMRNWEFNLIP